MGVAEYVLGLTDSVHSKIPKKPPAANGDERPEEIEAKFLAIPQKSKTHCNTCGKKLDRDGAFCAKCWMAKMCPLPSPEPGDSHMRYTFAEGLPGRTRINKPRKASICTTLIWTTDPSPGWENAVRCMEDG